ncbi:MAG: hypothetical protein KGI98_04155 [Euryarchaeota archaeon]|nr:hypothetical protein [Euryarchaeota archaeon]MDE1880746.1 hypothetical protein [Euryarchaeota archaeon]
MSASRDPGSGARGHLARLCRGFLLAREEDPRRAEAFLVTFLSELDRSRPGLGKEVAAESALSPPRAR